MMGILRSEFNVMWGCKKLPIKNELMTCVFSSFLV